jgi:hypothetical protein
MPTSGYRSSQYGCGFTTAIAYTWITEGTYDKAYIATHSAGFERFEEYVMGKEDGIPKTPEWAAEKTGIPEWTIKALARDWAKKPTSIAHGNGGPGIRSAYSTEPARLEVFLLAMQGLGKPGSHQVKMMEWGLSGCGGPKARRCPTDHDAADADHSLHYYQNRGRSVDGIIDEKGDEPGTGGADDAGTDQPDADDPQKPDPRSDFKSADKLVRQLDIPGVYGRPVREYTFPKEGCSEIHMIWTDIAVLDHLLERQQLIHQGNEKPQDRIYTGAASLAGERLPVCRSDTAGEYQVRRGRCDDGQ